MSLWFNTKGSGTRLIFSNENSTALLNLYINENNQVALSTISSAGVFQNTLTISDMTITTGTWYFTALKWQFVNNTLNCTVYINNTSYGASVSDFKDFTGVITALGSNVYSNYLLNGFLEGFTYTREALSDSDIQLLYTNSMPDNIGTSISNSYSYENDRIKTITHNGFSYKFQYDRFGNNESVYVEDQVLIQNTFEQTTGNLLGAVYGGDQNQKLDMSYDNLDRIISRKFNGEERYTYEYDNSGNLGYHEDKVNNKSYRYVYDLADRLVRVNEFDNSNSTLNHMEVGYDKSNNQNRIYQKIKGNIYETVYEYDKDNKPLTIFYGEPLEDDEGTEYFELNGSTAGSKGTVPTSETAVFQVDESGKTVLSAYPGTKVIYGLGLNKTGGTMTAWISAGGTGSRIIIGNEGSTQLFNLYADANDKVNLAVMNSAGVFTNVITTEETIGKNTWEFVALQWSFSSSTGILRCAVYLNSKAYNADVTSFRDFTGVSTIMGSNLSGNYTLNGLIKQFTYSPSSILSGDSILKMYHRNKVEYEYDIRMGRVSKRIVSIGLKRYDTYYGYVGGSKVNSTTDRLSSIQNQGESMGYEYDANGNITSINQVGMSIFYFYNELNELIKEDNQVLDKTVVYSYDEGGNMTQRRETQHGTGVQTVTTYSYDNIWKDKLVNYNGKQITYDVIGNPLTYDGYTYTWEEGRQLKSIAGNNKSISFKYNDSGIRTEKAVDGIVIKYYITGNKITFEDNGTDSTYYTYDDEGKLISMNLNGVEYYYIRNGQKDITGLFDSSAVQVVSYLYDSWGRLVSIKDQDGADVTDNADHVGYKNPYRYRGYRYDSETGLYYLNSRYYNPEWGRYLNTDAVAGKTGVLLSHNLFAYSMNNPINMEDPNGYWPAWLRRVAAAVKRVFNYIVRASKV